MQGAIVAGGLYIWSDLPEDRPPLHVAVLMSVFVAYAVTFCTLMVVEAVALIRQKIRDRRLRGRQSEGRSLATAARSHPERRG